MTNRVVHFEVQADDCERAMKFYKDVFGWEFMKWEGSPTPYWMLMTAPKDSKDPGINGGLLPRPVPLSAGMCGSNAFVATVQVDSYEDIEKKILSAGGKVAMPKFSIGGMAWQGYYLDTEGNTFGLLQTDANAK